MQASGIETETPIYRDALAVFEVPLLCANLELGYIYAENYYRAPLGPYFYGPLYIYACVLALGVTT